MTSSTQLRPNKYQAITMHNAMYIIRIRIAAKFQYNLPIISVDIPLLEGFFIDFFLFQIPGR